MNNEKFYGKSLLEIVDMPRQEKENRLMIKILKYLRRKFKNKCQSDLTKRRGKVTTKNQIKQFIYNLSNKVDIEYPEVKFKNVCSYWGRTYIYKNKKINKVEYSKIHLNNYIPHLPSKFIKFIVIHELMHLKNSNIKNFHQYFDNNICIDLQKTLNEKYWFKMRSFYNKEEK